jgi:hypothetical protein
MTMQLLRKKKTFSTSETNVNDTTTIYSTQKKLVEPGRTRQIIQRVAHDSEGPPDGAHDEAHGADKKIALSCSS